ncbi:ATP-dependent RNA helicase [Spraguea lophii 42_110]|uniref:ATP-dependent RNA helicase n=1 Tax=Spraguea lophii (strain 42_110) TaxID=1358809 RepID=S7W8E4_SPRLO|nr:ATP-dependent RNA helicase [Spraguea lophii 42_110]
MVQTDEDVARELHNLLCQDSEAIEKVEKSGLWSLKLTGDNKLLVCDSFSRMNLKPELLRAIYSLEIEKPSIVQSRAIPEILLGKDLVCQSKSGSGKTITFACGALNFLKNGMGPQAIIIAPTRELAVQVGEFLQKLGSFLNIGVCLALKGRKTDKITEEIIVGTPGSLFGYFKDDLFDTSKIGFLVIDEADAVLDPEGMGAMTHRLIMKLNRAQKIYFSATYNADITEQIESYSPGVIKLLEGKNEKPEEIKLFYIEIHKKDKIKALLELYELLAIGQSIVFVSTKKYVDFLKTTFESDLHVVSCIHGDMDLNERERIVKEFKEAKSKILISTDVFSRGMDIPQVNLIINFDLPIYRGTPMTETYIHRIGRSGRFGRLGFVIDFVSSEEELKGLMKFQSDLKFPTKKFSIEALRKVVLEN